MRILAISGSLRRDSHNTAILRAVAEMVPPGVELDVYDALKLVPPYDGDDDGATWPEPVERLRDAVSGSDALLISTPEYNSSIPGQLKNALDWLSRPHGESVLNGVPAAVVGAGPGSFGAVWAQAETRKVLAASGARVLERELAIPNTNQVLDGGVITDEEVTTALAELVGELAQATGVQSS